MLTKPRPNDSVLVALLPEDPDLGYARDEHWYRIRYSSYKKWFAETTRPNWIAFYQLHFQGFPVYAIKYYAQVTGDSIESGYKLIPDNKKKRDKKYWRLSLGPLQTCQRPIVSRTERDDIVFIVTTGEKFSQATEINDLFHTSYLEDTLWAELKRLNIYAERQVNIRLTGEPNYFLDFALYCMKGKIAIETDGMQYHKQRQKEDRKRENILQSQGWHVLRYDYADLHNRMAECLDQIAQTVRQQGDLDIGAWVGRSVNTDPTEASQLSLWHKT